MSTLRALRAPIHDALLSVDQAAARLTLKPLTIRKWIALKKIGIVRIGSSVRIPESEIMRVLAAGWEPAAKVWREPAR